LNLSEAIMFLAIVFIILGIVLLLNALGIIISANFWGIFWAIVFLAVGINMLVRRGNCPMCGWRGRIHDKMHGHCCDHEHQEEDHH